MLKKIFYLLVFFLMIAFIQVEFLTLDRMSNKYERSNANLQHLVQIGMAHGKRNDGRLPYTHEELCSGLSSDNMDEMMDLPYTEQHEKVGYGIVPGLDTWMFPETIFAFETVPRPDGTIGVSYLNGTVGTLPKNTIKAQKLMRQK